MAPHEHDSASFHIPTPDEACIPEIEDDETTAPRPEEEIANVARAAPDTEDHGAHPA